MSQGLSRRGMVGGALGAGLLTLGGRGRAAVPSGISPAGVEPEWPRVTALVDRYVSERRLPGAMAAFGWGDGPLQMIVRGSEGFDDHDAMGANSLFRVYSMTKPITGMAAMQLIDEGKLALDQPLSDIFPQFARMRVALDPAKGLAARPARAAITMRHLLTHTAGFGYAGISRDAVGDELLRQGLAPAVVSRLEIPGISAAVPTPGPAEFLRRAAGVPLVAEPGTRWSYSMSLDILGLVIQQVSGARSLAEFLRDRLFRPAGMPSTFFRLPRSAAPRLATNYGVVAGIPVPIDKPADSAYLAEPAFAFGGAGLLSTPADYDRFLRLLLGQGVIEGRRVLGQRAVAMGLSNLLPPGVDTRGTYAQGGGFGAGGRVGLGDDSGTFGWSGAAGTVAFINSRLGLRAGLYAQFMPPNVWPMQEHFLKAVRDDVMERVRK